MSSELNLSNDHVLFIANEQIDIKSSEFIKNNDFNKQKIREKVEPWLTAIFQSEHLSLLVGSGLTIALSELPSNSSAGGSNNNLMQRIEFNGSYKELIKNKADEDANNSDRGESNFEDDLRVAINLLRGYEILKDETNAKELKNEINEKLKNLLRGILAAEHGILDKNPIELLKSFLISFASRTATRERLNLFTTNYDRVLEYGLDEAGILTLDRFIGKLKPIMRFHRIDLDYHYNPPGIRGEPRYVEGVVKFTKLHGSIDWAFEKNEIVKMPIPFGAQVDKNYFDNPYDKVVIFPNSSKAVETSYFPYSELFRDFSTAICRPNSVLVAYGYGFGDSHINRIIKDMLTIPSTHLLIISYNWASGRIKKFVNECNHSQLTLLIGKELAKFENLVTNYLPKPAIDRITDRQAKILDKRGKLDNKVANSNNMEAANE